MSSDRQPRWSFKLPVAGLALSGWLCVAGGAMPVWAESAPAPDSIAPPIVVSQAGHEQFVFAHRLLRSNRLEHAAEAFDQFLREFPNDEKHNDGRYFRAELAMGAGDLDRADELLRNIGPTTVVTPVAVAILQSQVDLALMRIQPAVARLQAIALDDLPPTTVAWIRHLRGRAYVSAGNLEAAATQLDQAARVTYSQQAAALFELGQVLGSLGQVDRAIAALGRCVSMNDPVLSPRAARLGGDLSLRHRRYDRAIQFSQAIIEHFSASPEFGPAVIDLLWALQGAGRHEEVIAAAGRHFAAIKPEQRLMADYLAGVAAFDLGRFDEAARRMSTLREQAPQWERRPLVMETLARCFYELERFEELDRLFDAMQAQHPDTESLARTRILMARRAMDVQDGRRAIALLSEVTKLGPQHPAWLEAKRQKVVTHEQLGQWEPALTGYRTLLALDPMPAAVTPQQRRQWQIRSAASLMQLERFDEAREVLRPVVADTEAGEDTLTAARLMLGQSLIRLDARQEAIELFTAVIDGRGDEDERVASARYWRGLAYLIDRKPDLAVADLTAAGEDQRLDRTLRVAAFRISGEVLQRIGDAAGARQSLGRLEALVGVDQLTAAERLWLARDTAQRAESAGDHRQVLRYLGPLLENQQRLMPAVAAEADFLAAIALRELGERDQAMRGLHKVIGVGQGFGSQARLELARTLADTDPQRALVQYDLLLLHESGTERSIMAAALNESARVFLRLAARFSRDQQAEQARTAVRQAERRLLQLSIIYRDERFSPLPELALIELERIARAQNRTEDARKAMEDLRQLSPNSPWEQYAQAMVLLNNGQRNRALDTLRRLRDLPPPEALASVVRQRIAELE